MKGPLQPIAAQQQLEPQQASAGAKENASLATTKSTTTKSTTAAATMHSSSPPPPAVEPVDDAPVMFAKSLALAKKVAETGDASVDLGDDENGKTKKSGIIDVQAPGGVAALLSRVLKSSADLEGRCVGRNRDDARAIRLGLVELAPAVGALERRAAEAGGGVAEVKRGFFLFFSLFSRPPTRKRVGWGKQTKRKNSLCQAVDG